MKMRWHKLPRVRETARRWRDRLPNKRDYLKHYELMARYGVSLEQYKSLLTLQAECCAICGRHQSEFKRALALDHNHKTNEVRGLLCGHCNTSVGQFEKVGVENAERFLDYILNRRTGLRVKD
jgi:hypothetical protein